MNKQKLPDVESTPLDEAARAGWLYYVGQKTQDQIAREMGISRQRAQRLVSKAIAERLIRVRLDHRLSTCLALEAALTERFDLRMARVAPSLGPGVDPVRSVAPMASAELERILATPNPLVIAMGTGRMLRASIEELPQMECPQHKIVSLIGNIAPDGSASFFDVIMRVADKTHAPHFPMPLPVIAATTEERDLFHSLAPIRRARDLASRADVTFVGVGQMSDTAPLYIDGFLAYDDLRALQAAGAVGEMVGWPFDAEGRYIDLGSDFCVAGVRVTPSDDTLTIAVAAGPAKIAAIRGALRGRLASALITDESTASALLSLS
ncbi:MAG: sugar-binding transcriptional regulator [Rhodobacteraceae bacterium]|nr:sugar-binding transcriptional regulator [Paracoccaceae bacterium]